MIQRVLGGFRTTAAARLGGQCLALRARQTRFAWMSSIKSVHREANITGAVLSTGRGTIRAGGAHLGYWPSLDALTSCVYLEARNPQSAIEVGRGSHVNNGTALVSEGPGIFIGERTLIGPRVIIMDSDFHALALGRDNTDPPKMGAVHIGDDVFIGACSVILQGVTIGDGAVIGAGAIVVRDVAGGAVVTGSPARAATRFG